MPRTVPARSLYDTLACTACGGSPAAANSWAQNVRAKKPRKSGCGSIRTSAAPATPKGSKRISPPEKVVVDLTGPAQVANLLESPESPILVGGLVELDLLEARAQLFSTQTRGPAAAESGQLIGNLVKRYAIAAIVGAGLSCRQLATRKHVGDDLRDLAHPIVL